MPLTENILASNKIDILGQLILSLFDLLNHAISDEFVILHDSNSAQLIFD